MTNSRTLVSFCLLLIAQPLCAQNQKTPLKEILQSLESAHDVSFNYAVDNIEGVSVIPPSKDKGLEEALAYLAQLTGLQFKKISDRFIAITKPKQNKINICGRLVDTSNDEFIEGATILVGTSFTVSDAQGRFQIDQINSDQILSIQSLGYKKKEIPATQLINPNCGTIELNPEVTALDEIVITNYLAQGINKKLSGVFEVNTQNFGILPGLVEPDVLHTLQALPGIQSIDETVSDINVRGGTNDQNLVLWDGIRIYQPGHFFGLISVFNPYLTKKVELIKNGTSAFYGDGVSSSIVISTDDQITKEFEAGGGINLINADFFVKTPLSKNMSLQVSARKAISDVFQTPTYEQYFDRAFSDSEVLNSTNINADQEFDFYDFSVKYIYKPSPKDKFKISFLNIHNDINFQENAVINNTEESRNSGLVQRSLGASTSYERVWHQNLKTSVQLYVSDYDLEAVNFDIPNNQRLIQENEVLDNGIKVDARWRLNNSLDIFSGYQFSEVGVRNLEDINTPRFRRNIKRVVRSNAFFSELNYTPNGGNTNLRGGMRLSHYARFNRLFTEPRLAFNQKITNSLSLEVLGELKHQTTTQIIDFQTDFLGVEKRRWIMTNETDIPIIQSRQISAGLQFKKEQLLVTLETYFKTVDDIISSSQGFQNQFEFIRSKGSYDAVGMDLLVNRRFANFSSWLSYSLAESTFNFPGFSPPSFPDNLDIRHSITIGTNYNSEKLDLSIGLNWRTGKPFTSPDETEPIVSNEINYGTPNALRLDNYLRLDLSGKYKFYLVPKVRATIGLSIWNVPNQNNIIDTYFELLSDGSVQQIEESALGITPNLMFRVNF
ncbi:MAG: TonB-dependent receptor plug domain-containing protein [Bacteroidota bacterium]